jgi:hypothetical protein
MTQESINVAGAEYKFSKLPVLNQIHVARRLTPILSEIAPLVKTVSKDSKGEDYLEMAAKGAAALSKLSDDEFNYILFELLSSVSRKQAGGGWAPVVSSGGKAIMFQDIDNVVSILRLMWEAVMCNFKNFTSALYPTSGTGA